jgi:glycosyltransferase involved in cell wall biosynthesis
MSLITALLHTENDGLRLGRVLETVYPCDEILVVDHGSRDATVRVAREYGARVVEATSGFSAEGYLQFAKPGWVLCLDPRESLTEKLAASVFEWKSETLDSNAPAALAFSMFIREETAEGWVDVPAAQTRLVPQTWNFWKGPLPVHDPSAIALEGELLRFVFP